METEILTSPEETQPEDTFTEGESSEAPSDSVQTEAYSLSVADYNHIAISSIPIGALSGAIFMIIGLSFLGIVKIFKKI